MKRTWFLLMVCLFSSAALATFRFNAGQGAWADGTMWDKGFPPLTTSEELKITRADNICRVDSNIGTYSNAPRVSVANAETTPAKIVIEADGYLSVGEFRIGAGGATGEGSTGIAEQTGGTLYANDVYVSRYGGSAPPIKGYYTISGGLLSYNPSANGRLYVGTGAGGGYTEGTFTMIGNQPTVQMDTLYVGHDGSGNSARVGTGTIEFVIGASGVSALELSDAVWLDGMAELSTALLEVSTEETTLADADIVLITLAASSAVNGTFDALNGGPAIEGSEVILADNIYALTYQYNGNGDTYSNDVALVYVAGVNERPNSPAPANLAVLGTSPLTLSWTNPDPNDGVSDLVCTVYFGTEPNYPDNDSVTLAANASSVEINGTSFPASGTQPIANGQTFYWLVEVSDPSWGPEPIKGSLWSFTTDYNAEPAADAGPDQAVWLGKSGTAGQELVTLSGIITDDGRPLDPGQVTSLWTQEDNGAPAVIGDPLADPASVLITQRGTYVFVLTADDGEKQDTDSVQVFVGSDACDASHLSSGQPYNDADFNQDCIVDLVDFATMIAANWLDCTDTQTNCLN